LIWLLNLYLLP